MKPGYAAKAYDLGEVKVVVTRRGMEKAVRDEGSVGPLELSAIELAIEGLRAGLTWKRQ
jgi:hypothetical protein